MNRERFKRRPEASAYIEENYGFSVSPRTLANYAVSGGGPAFRKAGRTPLYSVTDLDAWAESRIGRKVHSTSELLAEAGAALR